MPAPLHASSDPGAIVAPLVQALVPFQRPTLPSVNEIESYFARSRQLGWFANGGPCHSELMVRASDLLGGRSVMPTSSAGLGLILALKALVRDASTRRKVLVPSFTFAASAAAVVWCGLEPVFVDIDPDSWHMCPNRLQEALASRQGEVAAVLACSTFGTPPPADHVNAWTSTAAEADLPLVIDSAAGLGTTGALGADAEVYSMHATKPMPVGEGGLVAVRDPIVGERIRVLMNHGLDENHQAVAVGLNAKLDEWHSAVALAGLDRLAGTLAARQRRSARVRDALKDVEIRFQVSAELSSVQFIPALMASDEARDDLLANGRASGVQMRTYFYPPLHMMPAYAHFERADDLDVTCRVARRMVSLPMANDLSDVELERIVTCVRTSA